MLDDGVRPSEERGPRCQGRCRPPLIVPPFQRGSGSSGTLSPPRAASLLSETLIGTTDRLPGNTAASSPLDYFTDNYNPVSASLSDNVLLQIGGSIQSVHNESF